MKFKRAILAAILIIALAGAFSVIIGGSSSPLADREDAVIVQGKALPAPMLGAQRSSYRLFALQGSSLAPIPFQIDERDGKGNLLMQTGPKVRADSDKGAFDANDELVFMAFDTAGKVSAKPEVAGCESFAEIAVTDSKKGATGYAYLAKCSKPPAPSKKKYVNWDAKKHIAITDSYKMGWEKGNDYYYDYLSLFGGPDVLDRLKVRVAVGRGALRKVFNEDNFEPHVEGYIIGPVRVVYIDLSVLKLGPFGGIPAFQYIYFYRNWVYLHNTLDSSMNPAVIGLDFEVGIIHDLSLDRKRGYQVCTNSAPNCEKITGDMPPIVAELTKKELNWGGIQGPEGTIMTRLIMDPGLPTKSMGVYLDDANARNKPEYIPGSGPEIGFMIVDWKNAPKGVNYLDFYHYFMKKYSKAEVERFSRITSQPLKVKVTAK